MTRAWIEDHGAAWSENYRRQVKQRLEADAFPYIGVLPIKSVKPAHVLDVVERVKKRSPTMANLLKTWIGGVFRYAAGRLLVEDDPTYPLRGSVKLPKVNHHPHLDAKEIGPFLRALESAVAEFPTVAACKLLWLTVVRAMNCEMPNGRSSTLTGHSGKFPANA